MSEATFRPAWWVPGAHTQTLWGKLVRARPNLPVHLERWATPDDDFIEVYRLDAEPRAPRLILLHGLEGTIRSHYLGGLLSEAYRRNWGADVLMFRGCGTEMNHAPRFYHSGETTDLAFVTTRVMLEFPKAPLFLCGVSLGGNVLLKWLGERGESLPARIRAAAPVSVPFDLEQGSRYISRGFARVYERHFLRSLRRKAVAKLERYPGLFDLSALERAQTLYDFDDVVTAPVHGFLDAHDYYTQSSSLRFLQRIRRRTLLLSAFDDPFLPRGALEDARRAASGNPHLVVEFSPHGGHVGFVCGRLPFRPQYYIDRRIGAFFEEALAQQKPLHSRPTSAHTRARTVPEGPTP